VYAYWPSGGGGHKSAPVRPLRYNRVTAVTVSPVHKFPPLCELLVCYQPHSGKSWRVKSLYMKRFWFVHWACRADTRDFCPLLDTLVSSVQSIFPPYTISMLLSPSSSKLGRQPWWTACLLVGVSGGETRRKCPTCEDREQGDTRSIISFLALCVYQLS